ncbi:hypothetical protein ABLE92_23180 [Gordonia sp. VNQ95]|uniref:hypothetical protein n=1 Tax=Gordonia sp. VNQ95 TaxID=3156619 RepID=UPI0032B49BE3
MLNRTSRTLAAVGLSAAALAVAAPAVAHADGTQDPAYSQPPTADSDQGTQLNERRAPLQQCPGGAQGGEYSANPSYFPIELNKRGPSTFTFEYNTINIPDKFDILYDGKQVYTTGWRGTNSAEANRQGHTLSGGPSDSVRITLPAGRSTQIEVRVNTDDVDTKWSFSVECPN